MIAAFSLLLTLDAAAADCPEARVAWQGGAPVAAEAAARICLEADPQDPETQALLAQAVAAQGRSAEALTLLADALAGSPGDVTLLLTRARVLWWSGAIPAAWETIRGLPPEALADPDALRLASAVALASGEAGAATGFYTTLLARDPTDAVARLGLGRARRLAGDDAGARQAFDQACASGLGDACRERAETDAHTARFLTGLYGTWSGVAGRPDGAALKVRVDRRLAGMSRAGGEVEVETRQGGLVTDVLLQATGTWDSGRGGRVSGAGGGAPAARFFPRVSAWIEPAWRIRPGVVVGLRAWWMDTADRSVPVGSPVLEIQPGPWLLRARSWHAPAHDGTWHHFGLLGVARELPAGFLVEVGAGGGNGADYLVFPVRVPDRAWLTLLDGAWAPTPLWRLRLGGSWRNETAGDLSYRELRVTAGVERPF